MSLALLAIVLLALLIIVPIKLVTTTLGLIWRVVAWVFVAFLSLCCGCENLELSTVDLIKSAQSQAQEDYHCTDVHPFVWDRTDVLRVRLNVCGNQHLYVQSRESSRLFLEAK